MNYKEAIITVMALAILFVLFFERGDMDKKVNKLLLQRDTLVIQKVYYITSSYYGQTKDNRMKNKDGSTFDENAMCVASDLFPRGTKLLITYPKTGNSVVCIVRDSGIGREWIGLDVRKGPAKKLGNRFMSDGIVLLKVEVIK